MISHEAIGPITINISWLAVLPLLSVAIPIFGSFLILILHKLTKIRNITVILVTLLDFLVILLMYKPVIIGIEHAGHIYRYLEYSLPTVLGLGINFRIDGISLLIGLITALIWFLSCIYATSYMSVEHAQNRYYFFVLLTLAANLGIIFTKDFFSLFLFFELMAIFSYVLVIHLETKEAMEAGYLYLFMCIIGGLALLAGIIIMYVFTGTAEIKPVYELLTKTMPSSIRYLMAILMIVGFGSKAGVFFLHIWLPEAHPIAPTPASALLSGLMIKAGAYGILRTVNTLFAPTKAVEAHFSEAVESGMLQQIGYWLIWLGVITMFFGVVNALLSANCKRMLAYHSVSQMGYIVMGLGCAAFLGTDGAMGLTGSVYHIINHAIFKSALFLSVGAVYFRTRELDMYKLGGLWRNMPFVAIACFIAVMGISGVPLFNGFASKTILHHAILESYEFTLEHNPNIWLLFAEIIFCITAFGTFCSNVKMWLFVFIWKRPARFKNVKSAPMSMNIALGVLSALILFIGLRPNWLIERFIGPALADFGFNPSSHAYHIIYNAHATTGIRSTIALLYDPKTLEILQNTVIKNLQACGLVVMGGGMTFVLGYRFGLFHIEAPEWISVKYWYILFAKGFKVAVSRTSSFISSNINEFYYVLARNFISIPNRLFVLRRKIKNNIIPLIYGFSERTQKSIWREELINFLEMERRDHVRKQMRRYHFVLINEGYTPNECWIKLQKEREIAFKEADKLIKIEEDIINGAEKAMITTGLGREKRRERMLDMLKLISDIRKSGDTKSTLDRVQKISQIIPEISSNKKFLSKDIIFTFAIGVREKIQSLALEKDKLEKAVNSKLIKDKDIKKKVKTLAEEKEFWEIMIDKTLYEILQIEGAYRKIEKSILARIAAWFRKMMRIATEIFTEERVPWEVEKYVSQNEVAEARTSIRRYTRDMEINLLVIVLLVIMTTLLLFIPLIQNK